MQRVYSLLTLLAIGGFVLSVGCSGDTSTDTTDPAVPSADDHSAGMSGDHDSHDHDAEGGDEGAGGEEGAGGDEGAGGEEGAGSEEGGTE